MATKERVTFQIKTGRPVRPLRLVHRGGFRRGSAARTAVRARPDFLGDLFAFAQRPRGLAHSPKLPIPSGPY